MIQGEEIIAMGSQCQNSLYRLDQNVKALAFKAEIFPSGKKMEDWLA